MPEFHRVTADGEVEPARPLTVLEAPPRAGFFPSEPLPKNWGRWIDKDDLSIWDWNPPRRQRNDSKYRETRDSLAQEGQVEPVVVQFQLDRTPKLIDGNRRLRAADELGWRKIWAVELPLSKDAARVSAVRNMKVRAWNTHELMSLAQFDPSVIDQLSPNGRSMYATLVREVPQDVALAFASRHSIYTVRLARHAVDYTGAPLSHVIAYILNQGGGVILQLEQAQKLHIPSHRLKTAIENNLSPESWWVIESEEEQHEQT
jgi:ParB-like nuclease domain